MLMLHVEIPDLNYQQNKLRQVGSQSAYNSKNMTEADEAWNTMLTGHGIVSFPERYAAEHNMIATLHYSIESPEAEKSRVYVVEAYHAMHCLVSPRVLTKPSKGNADSSNSECSESIIGHMRPALPGIGTYPTTIIALTRFANTSCATQTILFGT